MGSAVFVFFGGVKEVAGWVVFLLFWGSGLKGVEGSVHGISC